jgi:lysozyme
MIINSLSSLLAYDEGSESMPYQDTNGIWTVGIGHNLEANPLSVLVTDSIFKRTGLVESRTYPMSLEGIRKAGGLTENEILLQFDVDTRDAEHGLPIWIDELHDIQPVIYAVLIDMAFNLGDAGFLEFDTFLGFVERGEYAAAADDLEKTEVYQQLTVRYSRLATMLRTQEWPTV